MSGRVRGGRGGRVGGVRERVAGPLRRAAEAMQRERDNEVPLGVRVASVMPREDAGGVVTALYETGVPRAASLAAFHTLQASVDREPDDDEDAERQAEVNAAIQYLAAAPPEASEGLRSIFSSAGTYGAIEGFLIGVAYVLERGKGDATRRRHRPGR
jgi:hypothetical protein